MTTWTVPAFVKRVVDGDTIVLDLDLGWRVWRLGERVRLKGLNAPEIDTDAGVAARQFVQDTLYSAPAKSTDGWPMVVFVSTGLDKYGRPLGVVQFPDGTSLNDLILKAGHAVRM